MKKRDPRRFDALLKYRKRKEDADSLKLAGSINRVRDAEKRLEEMEAHQRAILTAASQRSGTLNVAELRAVYQFERFLTGRMADQDAEIRVLKSQRDARRSTLRHSMKQRRVVEKIMENAYHLVEDHKRKVEQKEQDELASIRSALSRIRERTSTAEDHG